MNAFQPKAKSSYSVITALIEIPVALLLLVLFTPVHLLNVCLAVVRLKSITIQKRRLDALGRMMVLHRFQYGFLKRTANLYLVLLRKLAFVGVSMNHMLAKEQQQQLLSQYKVLPGLISSFDVHQSIGLDTASPQVLLEQQLAGGIKTHLVLMIKGAINFLVYQAQDLTSPKVASLFDLPINNVSMKQAVDWCVNGTSLIRFNSQRQTTQLGYFINAHSVNLAESDPVFKSCLRQANALFADGSGMRVAAKSVGVKLKSNVNGTDMLPKICAQAEREGKSIYLLGGLAERAEKTAQALQAKFPKLDIAGTHHGFFNLEDKVENQKIINSINTAQADIVLVGFGSPAQEIWCHNYLAQLQCTSVLAVGGLFDYYSGAIPRAPMVMRELGLEWIWRLRQEPLVKFKRYVIGTPQFLIRTFLLRQV